MLSKEICVIFQSNKMMGRNEMSPSAGDTDSNRISALSALGNSFRVATIIPEQTTMEEQGQPEIVIEASFFLE